MSEKIIPGSQAEAEAFGVYWEANRAKYRAADWCRAVADFRRQTHGEHGAIRYFEREAPPSAPKGGGGTQADADAVQALHEENRKGGMTYGEAQRRYMDGKRAAATAKYAEPVTAAPMVIEPGSAAEAAICRLWYQERGGKYEDRQGEAVALIAKYAGEQAGPMSPEMQIYERGVATLSAATKNTIESDYRKFRLLMQRYLSETSQAKGTNNV